MRTTTNQAGASVITYSGHYDEHSDTYAHNVFCNGCGDSSTATHENPATAASKAKSMAETHAASCNWKRR